MGYPPVAECVCDDLEKVLDKAFGRAIEDSNRFRHNLLRSVKRRMQTHNARARCLAQSVHAGPRQPATDDLADRCIRQKAAQIALFARVELLDL